MEITPIQKNALITSCRFEERDNPSAERAFQVVTLLSKSMIESSLKSGRSDVAMAESFLDGQIADHEKRLTLAEQRLAEFKKKNVGMMPDEKGSFYANIQKGMEDIERTRAELQLAERRQTELRKQLSGETPLLGSGADPVEMKLKRSEAELADLLDHYTEQHPDVIRLKSRIDKLRAGIDRPLQRRRTVLVSSRTMACATVVVPTSERAKIAVLAIFSKPIGQAEIAHHDRSQFMQTGLIVFIRQPIDLVDAVRKGRELRPSLQTPQ